MDKLPNILCRHCGQITNGTARFCSNCGQPVRSHRKRWVIAGVGASAMIIIILLRIALLPDAPRLDTGRNIAVTSQTITAEGGRITVGQGELLDGLVLEVPPEAYSDDQTFDIKAATINDHDFGVLFQPVSPLITIDNGHKTARLPMVMKIPVSLAADEFAMAFYYDRTTGELEGIPCITQDSQSITIATRHFSSIVVSKVKKSLLEGRILEDDVITDFLPGMSDFVAANHGSFAEQGGHCAGQVLAMIHYYNMNANDNYSGRSLRSENRVDNGLLTETPSFWQDDALAFRFCSLLQNAFIWDNANQSEIGSQTEEIVYYSCAYAIALTNSPQVLMIYGKDQQGVEAGHALAVYAVSPAGLAVADPNMPGNLTRVVKRVNGQNNQPAVQLDDYFSGVNTSDPGMFFTSFTYFGTYSLFDFQAIDDLWQEVLAGRDVAAQLFPADPVLVALSGRDDHGAPIISQLQKLQSIRPGQAGLANPAKADTLLITVPAADPKMRLTFFRGTEQVGQPIDKPGQDTANWFSWSLQQGANDIGILYERMDDQGVYHFVNFYRYSIHYGDTPTGETEQMADTPFAGRWEFSRLEITGVSGGTESFWKDILFAGVSKEQWAYRYIGDFNDYLAHSDSHGPDVTFMSEIRIGLPLPPHSSQFENKYFFQTNYSHYSDQYPEIDGELYRYRFSTIPAEMLDAKTLHAAGYDGTGGLDDNDMHLDITLSLTDSNTAEGNGTVTMDMASAGSVSVTFNCAMVRKSKRSGLKPEFGSP